MGRRAWSTIGVWFVIGAVALVIRLLAAPGSLVWPSEREILELRAIDGLSAAAIGASLAVAGAILQAILRNPLASPYVLGVTSGASLGVVVATYLAYVATGAVARYEQPILPALIGAMAALVLVYWLGRRAGGLEPTALILIGIVVTVVFGAVSTFFQSLLSSAGLETTARWLMGSISDDVRWNQLALTATIAVTATAVAAWLGSAFDAAMLSEDEALSVGVNLRRLRIVAFVLAAALTAGTLVLAGPIGFVGLIAPHLVRLMAGAKHRGLMIGSAVCGAALLTMASAGVALVRMPSGRVPIGVITALVGGPVFIVLLKRTRGVM